MERPSHLILEMLADPFYPSVIMPESLVHTSALGVEGAVKFFGTGPYRWVVHDDGEMVLKWFEKYQIPGGEGSGLAGEK